jgi:hypothetical protein
MGNISSWSRIKNTNKAKYMVVFHHQNSGQNHNLLIANKAFGNVAKFKYF